MSKEKTPVQIGIERKKEMLQLLIEQRRLNPPGNPNNEFDFLTGQIEVMRKVIQLDESIRDNQEKEFIAVTYEEGFADSRNSKECIGGIRYYNEKYGSDE